MNHIELLRPGGLVISPAFSHVAVTPPPSIEPQIEFKVIANHGALTLEEVLAGRGV